MVETEYAARRRFSPYVSWSRDVIGVWNDSVKIFSDIRAASTENVRSNVGFYRSAISGIKEELVFLCASIERSGWQNIPVDIKDIPRARSPRWLDYFVSEGSTFEALCANINSILADALRELERKLPGTLSGTVRDAKTGEPIGGVEISAGSFRTSTDIFGSYKIDNMTSGTYTVSASLEGYVEETLTAYIISGADVVADFSLEPELPPIPDWFDYIGTETDTGFDVYYDSKEEEYVELEKTLDGSAADYTKDSDLYREARRNEHLEITITASLETNQGNEGVACELTASTRVKGWDRDNITKIEEGMMELLNINREPGFEQLSSEVMKVGTEYRMGGRSSDYPRVDVITEKTKPSSRKREYPKRTESLRRYLK